MSKSAHEALTADVILVFKRLRSIFQKPEDYIPRAIVSRDLPLWLEERERAIDQEVSEMIAPHREVIVGTIERIREILELMGGKERDPAWHPKLEKIGKTALPNFIRSMHQVQDRSLPPTPSLDFYKEAASVLKSCIGAMKGAGKYLPMIFPDEMKVLRHEIREFGQAINAITAELAAREQERKIIHELRQKYTTFTAEQSHLKEAKINYERVRKRCADTEQRGAAFRKTIEAIKDSTDFKALEKDREQLHLLEREAREVHLKNDGVLGVILSLYRRAERIAYRNDDPGRAVIEEVIQTLGNTTTTCDQRSEVLTRSLPVITKLIEGGSLSLKGQEEMRIFGVGHSLIHEALQACREIAHINQKVTTMRDRLAAAPVLQQIQQLEQEMMASEEMRNRYRKELDQIGDHLETIPNRLRSHQESMSRMISDLSKGELKLLEEGEGAEKE